MSERSTALIPAGIVEPQDGVVLYDELPDDVANVGFFVPRYMGPITDIEATSRMPKLEVVQLLTAGYDAAIGRVPSGVTLCNAAGLHDASTVELAIALTLAKLRRLDAFARVQSNGEWLSGRYDSLADKTVLVIGHGSIGKKLCARIEAFEATAIPVAATARAGVHGIDEINELLPLADVVILIVPLNDGTKHLVDAGFLATMKPGALLVNVARGQVVVTDDLLEAVRSGRIQAAVDVTDPEPLPADHPLWAEPGILISPHVGGNSTAFLPRARKLVTAQLAAWRDGEQVQFVVSS